MGKSSYKALRALHRCTMCGKRDAFTLNGRCYCAECAQRRRDYYSNRYKDEDLRRRNLAKQKERRNRLKENHLCPYCGRKAEPPYVMCARCRAKNAKRQEKRKPYIDPAMCSRCHKFSPLPGRKICANCYARALELSRMGTEARRRKNDATSCDG